MNLKSLLQNDYSTFKKIFIYSYQLGFLPGRKTTKATLSLVDYIINFLENKNISCHIFKDVSKALNTVDLSILLGILRKYDIRGIALNLFKCCLSVCY